jgi:transposase
MRTIEIALGAAVVRVSPGTDVTTLTKVLRAVKAATWFRFQRAFEFWWRRSLSTSGAAPTAGAGEGRASRHPFSGTIFVFRSKRADRLRLLAWDGSGLILYWKRLEEGAFRWPPFSDGVMRLSASQLAALVDGLDWSRLHARDTTAPEAAS